MTLSTILRGNVNGVVLAATRFVGTEAVMDQPAPRPDPPEDSADDLALAPITTMLSSRLMVLANLLKRGAILRYKRLAGLSAVEFGLVASLGRRPPISVARLAQAVGQDKGQISRALSGLVERKLVARAVNPRDSREVLVNLTHTGLAAHDAIVAGGLERNQRLVDGISANEIAALKALVDRLTVRAEEMLAAERDLT
jgi:DNA-binding MarR family transcriptional regulator